MGGKRKAGQPTHFKIEYCEALVDHMRGGKSFRSFAAKLDKHWDTLYDWVKSHPEFSDAKKRGDAVCLDFWEEAAIESMHDPKGLNTALWIFNMKNRFGWRDVQEIEERSFQTLNVIHSKGVEKFPV